MNDQTTTTGTASPLKRSVLKGKARTALLGHYMPLSSAFLSGEQELSIAQALQPKSLRIFDLSLVR